jgi:hypothetical protein
MKKIVGGLLVAFLLVGSAAGAEAVPPSFRSERVYFHCNGTTKAANVNSAQGVTATWNTTAPAASVTTGAGCGAADPTGLAGTGMESMYDAAFKGTFTGNVKSITVEAHMLLAGASQAAGNVGFHARLAIDGTEVIPAANRLVRLVPTRSASGASHMVRFSVTGLQQFTEPEEGDGATERSYTLTLHSYYVDQNPVIGWVYDTTEVPAGITFNPAATEAYSINL